MDAHRRPSPPSIPISKTAIAGEERRQIDGVEMIPSENYTYPEVLAALGSVLTNKYAEGYPGRRYYGGQEFTDAIERTAARSAPASLFRAEHANVQPLSGSPMNQAVYFGLPQPGDTVLAMDLQPRRPPDPRRAGLAHGQGVQLRPLQDPSRPGRALSTSTS